VSGPAKKLVFVTGHIKREGLGIPFDAPEHEVAVLREIHGEDDVIETGDHELDAGERTAATEYARLQSKYSGHPDAVRAALGSVRALARQSGLPHEQGDDAAVRQQAAEQRVGGKPAPRGRSKPAASDEAEK
jgi:hypothetical protein